MNTEVKEISQGIICAKNESMEVWFSTLGAAILRVIVKDRNGIDRDVVLGYETMEDYTKCQGYLGAMVGRCANRIREGKFSLNGKAYQIPINNGPNANHGGPETLSFQEFSWRKTETGVLFYIASPDGEAGFPGALMLMVNYILEGSTLKIRTVAAADEDTMCNFTNHVYINLSGHPKSIKDHSLQVKASRYGKVDEYGMFTGEIALVKNTVFDFNEEKGLADVLASEDEQIVTGKGLDHSFLLSAETEQALLYCPETGIECTVSTTMPVIQVYTANYVGGEPAKYGEVMEAQSGICFEAQCMPDEINMNPMKAATILRKGNSWNEETAFQFKVR
ncbi:MAG: galactose mutarotase [Erysipelotrichaceae bacterium]|nr:galactose mutarotase [Erysipelotrichaceae bacterium]